MARKKITHYAVFHNVGSTSSIVLYYEGGGADSVQNLSVAEAGFMIDLLRNEKPMSYDHALKRLSNLTSEPVGENE